MKGRTRQIRATQRPGPPCPAVPLPSPLGSAATRVAGSGGYICLAAGISAFTANPSPHLHPPATPLPPPGPRKGPVASVIRMSQVYGLEVLPGGCSLSCNQRLQGRMGGGGPRDGAPRLLPSMALASSPTRVLSKPCPTPNPSCSGANQAVSI